MEREQMEAGIRYNQSIPPNERVMFNADLLRHITTMIPTPLKEAVAFAKKNQDTPYIYWKKGLKEGQSISLNEAIQYLITALEKGEEAHIYDNFEVVKDAYGNEVDSFDDLYKFLRKLKIDGVFEFGQYYVKSIASAKVIFDEGIVNENVERALDYYNDGLEEDEEEVDEDDLECMVPIISPEEGLAEGRKQEAIRRLQEAHKLLTPKAKGKGK
jgi:tetratricopeptide (TPR) repeat protein